MKKIKKLLAFIFLLLVTLTFAESEIPHQIISDNPAKEVTTVESKKLKEKAELDILVNKITPIEIEGDVTPEKTTVYTIPKAEMEKNLLKRVRNKMMPKPNGEEKYFITENLSQILNDNQKQPRGRSKRSLPQGIEYKIENIEDLAILTVNTDKPVYIAKVRDGVLENVFSGVARKFTSAGSSSSRAMKDYVLEVGTKLNMTKQFDEFNYWNKTKWVVSLYFNENQNGHYSAIYQDTEIGNPGVNNVPLQLSFDKIGFKSWTSTSQAMLKLEGLVFRDGYTEPGNGWRRGVWEWENVWVKDGLGKDTYFRLSNIIKMGYVFTPGKTSLDANMYDIAVRYESRNNSTFQKVGVYTLNYGAYFFENGSGKVERDGARFIVTRGSKKFVIEPILRNISIANISNFIFDENNSTITGSGSSLPNDWYYRYDDSQNMEIGTDGLNLTIQELSGTVAGIDQIDKRRIRVAYTTGLEAEFWLEKVAGVGKFKYKIHSLGNEDTDVGLMVFHKVDDKILYTDSIKIRIPGIQSREGMNVIMDSRLVYQLNGWINIEGTPFGWKDSPYSKLLKITSYPNFNDGDITAEVTNYPHHWEQDGYNFYRDNQSKWNSVAIINKPTSTLINKDLYFHKKSGNHWQSTEIFTSSRRIINLVVGEDTKAPPAGYVGSGTLGMSFAQIGESIEFPMGGDAYAEMIKRNSVKNYTTETNFILKDFAGVFPNTVGMDGSKNIVDNLNVSVGSSSPENIQGTSFEREGISFELLANGNLKITKKTNNLINSEIKVEYRCAGVVLGKFTLKIVNYPTIEDIGNATFEIDSRMKNLEGINWYHRDGKVSANLNTLQSDYSKLFYSINNFSGNDLTKIYRVHSVEDRNYYRENSTSTTGYRYQVFSNGSGYSRYSAVPYDIVVKDIYNAAVISVYDNEDEKSLSNKFKLVTETLKPYTGNFVENYVGEEIQNSTASLDFSRFDLGTIGVWNIGATGKATSTNGSGVVLDFKTGKLFNTKDMKNTEVIVTKLVVKDGNGSELGKVEGTMGTKLEVPTTYNKFILQADGQLAISKIKRCYDEKTYIIEPYYNNLKLGELKVNILNDIPIDIGNIEFNIDKRLKNSPMGWVYFNGEVAEKSISEKKDYSELVKERNNLVNLNTHQISDVVSVEGRPIKVDARDYENNKLYYFLVRSGDYKDESAIIPYDIPLNNITKSLGTSINNDRFTDNIFTVETEDGIRYKGNIKEVFIGNDTVIAEGKINFRKTGHIATWEAGSTGLAVNGKTQIEFTSEVQKVFNSKGILNSKRSIANKLIVKQTNGETKEITGDVGANLIVKFDKGELFELDSNGRLTIRGSYEKTEKTFTIESYYNEALLGRLTVTLITGDAFIINGSDTYDFGKMLGGNEYDLTGGFHIQNLGNLNIVDVSIPERADMLKEGDTNEKIPLFLKATHRQVGQDVHAIIDLKAKPRADQPVGRYSGEFYITITINE